MGATATAATPLSRPSLASTSSPPSPPTTTLARGLLRQSPRLMLRLRPTLGWHTDTPDTATDTDTAAATTVDTPTATDTVATDIPTTDKDIAARFLYGYLPRYYPNVFREPISKCRISSHQRVLKPKKKSENKTFLGGVKKKKKKKKKKNSPG